MFHKFYDALYLQLVNNLCLILANHSDPVKILSAAMAEISKTLLLLRGKVLSIPFPSKEIEILFFKTIKPKFLAQKIFHFEFYALDMNKPVGTKDTLLTYYNKELLFIERFFSLQTALYHYYRTGGTEMDYLYFIRGAEISPVLVPEMPEIDPLYSTSMDYLFARFIAFELLRKEILQRIGELDGSIVSLPVLPELGLKWTGKVVDLAELIYGLHDTGYINHGNAQFSEIVPVFERMFNVRIRDVHHTFGEVMERKVSSPSKFIDKLAAAIKYRVEEGLRYKPKK